MPAGTAQVLPTRIISLKTLILFYISIHSFSFPELIHCFSQRRVLAAIHPVQDPFLQMKKEQHHLLLPVNCYYMILSVLPFLNSEHDPAKYACRSKQHKYRNDYILRVTRLDH